MQGIEGIHELNVELTVTTAMSHAGNGLRITVSAWVPTVEAQGTKVIAEVIRLWPNKEGLPFVGTVFNALYGLDAAVGSAYDQGTLTT